MFSHKTTKVISAAPRILLMALFLIGVLQAPARALNASGTAVPDQIGTASGTPDPKAGGRGNWLQRKLENKLLGTDQGSRAVRQTGWRLKPGVAFRMKRRGIDWSIGPRLGLSRQLSEAGRLTLNAEYLPLRFTDLRSGSQIGYSRWDLGYRHFLQPKMYAGFGVAAHRFDPSGTFRDEVAARGGQAVGKTVWATSLSLGHQVFKIGWSYRGKKRVWPFFAEFTYQWIDPYHYGADLGQAGSEFRIRSGLSFRIRPLVRRF